MERGTADKKKHDDRQTTTYYIITFMRIDKNAEMRNETIIITKKGNYGS